MLRRLTTLFTATLLAASTQAADISLGLETMVTEISGRVHAPDVIIDGNTGYDLNLDNFDTEKERSAGIYLDWRHENSAWPNLKLSHVQLEHSGPGILVVGGRVYSIERGKLNPSYSDITAYYQVMDSSVKLDLGLTLRIVGGDQILKNITFGGSTFGTLDSSLETELALAYGHLNIPVYKWISVGGELLFGDLGSESSSDLRLYASADLPHNFSIRAGYRKMETDIKSTFRNSKLFTTLEYEGTFATLFYHF